MQYKLRIFALLTALLLGLTAIVAPQPHLVALGESVEMPPLEIVATVTPEMVYELCEVTLAFSLTNPGTETLYDVAMTAPDGLLTIPLGDMAPGQTLTFTHAHTLSQAELNDGKITCLITCRTDTGRFSYSVKAPLSVNNTPPQVEFLRQFSSSYVSDGSSVTVVYQIRNTGRIPVSALTLSDAFADFEAHREQLAPGESWVLVNSASLDSDDESAPVLEFAALGSVHSRALDAHPIRTAHGKLDTIITAGRSLFDHESAEVILTLINSGNVDYSDIIIYDDIYGGIIADSLQLPAGGEPITIPHTYPLRGDSTYRWRVTGINSAGDRIDFVTEDVPVYADDAASDALLTLSVTAGMTHISRRGNVPFSFELTNIGSATASNVTLYEPSLGDVAVLTVIPTGAPTVREILIDVPADAVYRFSAIYTDRHGQVRTAGCDPIEISIGPGGESPVIRESANQHFSGASSTFSESSLFMKLIIGAGAVLLVLLITLLITSRRATMQRKVRDAVRKQRQDHLAKSSKHPKPSSKG